MLETVLGVASHRKGNPTKIGNIVVDDLIMVITTVMEHLGCTIQIQKVIVGMFLPQHQHRDRAKIQSRAMTSWLQHGWIASNTLTKLDDPFQCSTHFHTGSCATAA